MGTAPAVPSRLSVMALRQLIGEHSAELLGLLQLRPVAGVLEPDQMFPFRCAERVEVLLGYRCGSGHGAIMPAEKKIDGDIDPRNLLEQVDPVKRFLPKMGEGKAHSLDEPKQIAPPIRWRSQS